MSFMTFALRTTIYSMVWMHMSAPYSYWTCAALFVSFVAESVEQ